jgi:multidrug efflux pump subunit AcrA (membrane-fusion protein)
MTEVIDSTTGVESAEAEGTEGSPEQKPTTAQDPLALARKRQAGAEAARQEAARQLSEAQAKLAKYESAERTADQQKAADIATLQAKLEAAEKRAADADSIANQKILDVKFPNARARLPEITDEVRLAEFEALFAEVPEDPEPPAPQNPNASNRAASGDATASQPKEETSQDILARLKAMGKPDWS